MIANTTSGAWLVPGSGSNCETFQIRHPTVSCPSDAVMEVVAGCVHEHGGPRLFCQCHIDSLMHGWLTCRACWTSADPHECKLVAITRIEAQMLRCLHDPGDAEGHSVMCA